MGPGDARRGGHPGLSRTILRRTAPIVRRGGRGARRECVADHPVAGRSGGVLGQRRRPGGKASRIPPAALRRNRRCRAGRRGGRGARGGLRVVGTAVIQAVVMAIGLVIAGIPGAALLGFVTLLLALSQIGAPLIVVVWGGAAAWLFGQDQQGWGIFLIVWGLIVSMMDNVIKPWLIGFGVAMPMSLTILGVFGGFVSLGLLGALT